MKPLISCAVLTVFVLAFHTSNLSATDEKAYRIGPRDVVDISIFAGGEKQQQVDLTVSTTGLINVPFIGQVKAAGLTAPELEDVIREPMEEDFFVNPEINVRIKEYKSLKFYISGAVNNPGVYVMQSETSLLQLVAKAGGVSTNRGNIAFIMRRGQNEDETRQNEPIKVNLNQLLDHGDMTGNLPLRPGDAVHIPPEKKQHVAESNIYIEGEVKKPGVYVYQPGITALNACIMAGGFDKFAAPNRTRIVRKKGDGQVIIKINLDDVKKGRIPDIELQPGDLVHVPETWL